MGDDRVWTVEDHLRGHDPRHVELFRAVEAAVLECGPVGYAVSRTTVTFTGPRRGFAGARPTRYGVRGYLDLMHRLDDDPRIGSVSPYTTRLFVHAFRLTSLAEVDETFRGWVREAYAVGQGAHLRT